MRSCDECGAGFDRDTLGEPPASSCSTHSRWASKQGFDVEPELDDDATDYLVEERSRPRRPPHRLPEPAVLALGSIAVICDFFQVDSLRDAEHELENLPPEQSDELAAWILERIDEVYWYLHAQRDNAGGIVADDQVYLGRSSTSHLTQRRQLKFHMLYSPWVATPDPGYRWAINHEYSAEALAPVARELAELEPLARHGGLFLLPPPSDFQPRVTFYGDQTGFGSETLMRLSTELADVFFEDEVLQEEALASDLLQKWERRGHDEPEDVLELMATRGLLSSVALDFMNRRYPGSDTETLQRALQMGVLVRDTGLSPATTNPIISRHLARGRGEHDSSDTHPQVLKLPMFASVSALDLLLLREDSDLTAQILGITQATTSGEDVREAAADLSESLRKIASRTSILAGVAAGAAAVTLSVISAPYLTPAIGIVGTAAVSEASSLALARIGSSAVGRNRTVARKRSRIETARAILRELELGSVE